MTAEQHEGFIMGYANMYCQEKQERLRQEYLALPDSTKPAWRDAGRRRQ